MKNWNKKEIDTAITLLKSGKSYYEIGFEIGKTANSVRNKLFKLGHKYVDNQNFNVTRKCLNCYTEFETLRGYYKKFCNHSCSAIYNNKLRNNINVLNQDDVRYCLNCGNKLNNSGKYYCNNKCQGSHIKKQVFEKIKNGDTTFSEKRYKDYLILTYGEKCMICGWDEKHPTTGNVPVQLEHIDGNSENNSLDNLKLLCPNHHSLTLTYGALNKGRGRKKRYLK